MLKRLFSLLILVPVGVVLIAVAVSNRQNVTIAVPPYLEDAPLYAFTIPLFVVLFAVLLIGMIVGSLATWFRQSHYRREARSKRAEVTELTKEIDTQKQRVEELQETVSAGVVSRERLPAPKVA